MGYSLDFRKRVFALKEKENLTFKETSSRFGISMATLFRWQINIEPCTKRDQPALKIDMEKLQDDIVTYPDAYNNERAERLGVSTTCVFYALRRLNITRKKNASA